MRNRPRVYARTRACVYALACALAILVVFPLASCKAAPKIDPNRGETSVRLETVSENIEATATEIKSDAEVIVAEASAAKQNIERIYDHSPQEEKEPLTAALNSVQEIDARADNIISESSKIQRDADTLKAVESQVRELETEVIKYKSATSQAQAQALEKLYEYINIFWIIGFAAIIGGAAVAFFANKGFGGTISLIGVIMIGFASASQYYLQEIAFTGAVILIGSFLVGLIMIGWSTVRGKNQDQAIKEIVELIEILKETMTDDEKERIFGEDGLASRVQSELTSKIITKVREKNGFLRLKEIKNTRVRIDAEPFEDAEDM